MNPFEEDYNIIAVNDEFERGFDRMVIALKVKNLTSLSPFS